VVLIGGAAAGDISATASQITATTPGGASGGVDVEVINPDTQRALATRGFVFDFNDLPTTGFLHDAVTAIARAGITAGCGGGAYCPNDPLSRRQVAALLERAVHGPDFVYPVVPSGFSDLPPCDGFAVYIAQLAADGLTNGCASGKFCPDAIVQRNQIAALLARSKSPSGIPTQGTVDGNPYDCEAGGVSLFNDVSPTDGFCSAIHDLAALHITFGCGGGSFCPGDPVNRAQAALFLSRAFPLP
jgi:hypothetical protein